ncbi:hypothetical protein GGS20DRAFT_568180 [Poronia punctata]|nr:hypothetical protein GGS20DRAFT_568180 [Poronia punctata]
MSLQPSSASLQARFEEIRAEVSIPTTRDTQLREGQATMEPEQSGITTLSEVPSSPSTQGMLTPSASTTGGPRENESPEQNIARSTFCASPRNSQARASILPVTQRCVAGCVCEPNDTPRVPEHHKMYMIRDISTKMAITLEWGKITLVTKPGHAGGWQWCCESNKGWLGFREVVSGKFMGRDKDDCLATNPWMSQYDSFVLRACEAGGYNLYIKKGDGFVAVTRDTKGSLFLSSDFTVDFTRWEFIRV